MVGFASDFARPRPDLRRSASTGFNSGFLPENVGTIFEKIFFGKLGGAPLSADITDSTFPYFAISLPMCAPAAFVNDGLSQTSCLMLSIPSCNRSSERAGE